MAEDAGRSTRLERARTCYAGHAWREAFTTLREVDEQAPLALEDLERLAWSAALAGDDETFIKTLERVFQAQLDAGTKLCAARSAFWIGFRLMLVGEPGRGGGWLGRCQRLVDEAKVDCVEPGYLLLLPINRHLMTGDYEAAAAIAVQATEIGERFGDADLVALARNLHGRALLRVGQIEAGMALLDESMVAATAGELSPIVTGVLYCAVIASCQRVYALGRAREWTSALSQWCEAQPELVTFRGACEVHRSEILQLGGDWKQALKQAERAAAGDPNSADREAAADACYQQGEIHRLRGEFDTAEQAYLQANELGRDPQPGLALLRAAQGQHKMALAGLERVLGETTDPLTRTRLLPACIAISLAVDDASRARLLCGELEDIARRFDSEVLTAIAAFTRGRLHLAENDARAALGPLRRAFFVWQQLGAPYEEACVRVALAQACRELGDTEGAELSLEAARAAFRKLGAAPDLAALEAPTLESDSSHGLTPRELQVLRLVATGMTNRAIAAELGLSDKTIDRHLSNIFSKIDVTSRAAATAYAYENKLI